MNILHNIRTYVNLYLYRVGPGHQFSNWAPQFLAPTLVVIIPSH